MVDPLDLQIGQTYRIVALSDTHAARLMPWLEVPEWICRIRSLHDRMKIILEKCRRLRIGDTFMVKAIHAERWEPWYSVNVFLQADPSKGLHGFVNSAALVGHALERHDG